MSKALITIVTIVSLAVMVGVMWMSASNGEIKLRNQMEAQKGVVESYFDKMWKVISQKAQVTEQYKESFKEIYPQLIEGRYGNDKGTLMKWVVESNPTFDVSLYKDLMGSIEAERMGFFMEQKRLIDLDNQHKIFRQTFPNMIFIGNRPDVEFNIVSSEKTKQIINTGLEDDIKVF
jgi:hypothetical protein